MNQLHENSTVEDTFFNGTRALLLYTTGGNYEETMKKKTSPANLLALHGQPTTAIMGTNRIQTAVKKLQHHQLKSTSTFFCTVSCEAAQEGCSFQHRVITFQATNLGFERRFAHSRATSWKFCQIISPSCWVSVRVVCTCLFIIVHQFLDYRIATYQYLAEYLSARRITGVASACQMCPFLQTQIKGIHQSYHAQRIGGSHTWTAQHDSCSLFGIFVAFVWGPGSFASGFLKKNKILLRMR